MKKVMLLIVVSIMLLTTMIGCSEYISPNEVEDISFYPTTYRRVYNSRANGCNLQGNAASRGFAY